MNQHVCFLVAEHPFLDARIFKKEAQTLKKQGYQVTMIVPRRNGNLFDVDGRIFHGRFQDRTFMYEGIRIVTYDMSFPEKMVKSLHYNLRSSHFQRFTDELTKLGIAEQADIYHAHEFFSLYSGVGVKRALAAQGKRIPLIYDSHELEPDPLDKAAASHKKIKQQMLTLMLHETDVVITVSDSIKSWYLALQPNLWVEVIYNAPPLAANHQPGRGKHSSLLLAFEGMISDTRGSFPKLMNILDLCQQTFDIKVRIIGGKKHGKNGLNETSLTIPKHLKERVSFTGWVDYDTIPEAMADVDLGWIDLDAEHSLNHRFAMPNKFFSYLNNGIPVLVNQCTDMENFIQRYQCGYIVKKRHATAQDYAKALRFLHAHPRKIYDMSLNARRAMEKTYNWSHMENRLLAVYDRLTKHT